MGGGKIEDVYVILQKVNSMSDYIIERGTINDWEYTKYYSGKVDLYRRLVSDALTITNQNGVLYFSDEQSIDYPFTISNPQCFITSGGDPWINVKATYIGGTRCAFKMFRGGNYSSKIQTVLHIYVHGSI